MSISLDFGREFRVFLNGKLTIIETKTAFPQDLSFSSLLDYLDINNAGIVYETKNSGVLTAEKLAIQHLDAAGNDKVVLHSIVGGG